VVLLQIVVELVVALVKSGMGHLRLLLLIIPLLLVVLLQRQVVSVSLPQRVMRAEHQVTGLLLVRVIQELFKTVFKVVAQEQLLMVATQQATHSPVLVVLVVTFQHGWVKRQQQLTRVAVAVVPLSTQLTGVTQHRELLLVA
jgi:hypothetical protein